ALETDNLWNPPSTKGIIENPGWNGGAEWGGPAFDPTTGILYINANESPWVLGPRALGGEQFQRALSRQTNAEVGKSLYEANCAVCHGVDRMAGQTNPALKIYPALAGAGVRLDEVGFKSLIATGQGTMPAFGQLNPAQRTAIASYVLNLEEKGKEVF